MQILLQLAFLRKTHSYQTITDLLKSHSNLTFFVFFLFHSLTVSVLIKLPESHASVCLSTSHFFHTMFFLFFTDSHVSVFLPPWLSVSFSVCPCLVERRDPLPPLCRRLTFITAWPWLSLLSSLLWCSITLSSWGKHWCQATVMTF